MKMSQNNIMDASDVYAVEDITRRLIRKVEAMRTSYNLSLDDIEDANHDLCMLKDIIQLRSLNSPKSLPDVPQEFLCPISGKIMNHPVSFFTNQVFDEASIKNWLSGYRTYNEKSDVFGCISFVPDSKVKNSVHEWCEKRLNLLLRTLSSSPLADKAEAAKEIRHLTKHSEHIRDIFGEIPKGFDTLIEALSDWHIDEHPDLRLDLITVFYNLSLDDRYRKLFSEMESLVCRLKLSLSSGTIKSRRTAASTISLIIGDDPIISQKFGTDITLNGLFDLLSEIQYVAAKEGVTLLRKLYICRENTCWLVDAGTTDVLLEIISDGILVEEILDLLFFLSSHPFAIKRLAKKRDGAKILFGVLNNEDISELKKEQCFSILLEMRKIVYIDLVKLAKPGRLSAEAILEFLKIPKDVGRDIFAENSGRYARVNS